jgi:hypothetical protein
MRTLFPLGAVTIRPVAAHALAQAGMKVDGLLERHVRGDWGEVRARDRKQNLASLSEGGGILSAYTLDSGARILVVTAADRGNTTALAASEYAEERRAAGWEAALLTSRRR